MVAKSCEKLLSKFSCEECEYSTSKKSSYDKHIGTWKHMNTINTIKYNKIDNVKKEKEYTCVCGKNYKHNASLFNHKKKCIEPEKNSETNVTDGSSNIIEFLLKETSEYKNIIMELVKSNTDLQKQMIDVCQQSQTGINNNQNNTNSLNTTNNKIFNLQLFLNEECKDAMNMSEFINTIEVQLSDLENISKKGYVEGMSNIIIKKLNDTDIYKRPMHCSDAKRETLYVKEEDKWEKEGPENSKMIKAVHSVDKKNYKMLNTWKDANPKCLDGQTKQCDAYMKLMSKVMDGDKENVNKVIKRVAKEIIIEKNK
jgi:hypothetical protein